MARGEESQRQWEGPQPAERKGTGMGGIGGMVASNSLRNAISAAPSHQGTTRKSSSNAEVAPVQLIKPV